ncbi:transmembrane protein, putative, partial [Rhizoctonia solani AG-3 Rhs1AP]
MNEKHTLIWQNGCRIDQASRTDSRLAVNEASNAAELQAVVQHGSKDFNTDELYRCVTRWIVTGNQPFTEVENTKFQDILVYLKPALEGHLLQSQAIRDRIFAHVGTMRNSIKQYLVTLPGLMTIACDAWTSSNRIAFLAIVGSWITMDWNLEETLLDFVELQGAHDGQNMASAVSSVIAELGVANKLVALVSNNASNNGTLVHHLETELEQTSDRFPMRWDSTKGHIQCLSHVIHLSVMSLLRGAKAVPRDVNLRAFDPEDQKLTPEDAEAFVADNNDEANEHDDDNSIDSTVDLASAVDKIRKIAKLVHSSPQRMQLFRANAESIEDYYQKKALSYGKSYTHKVIKNLILDVVTQWNSTYFMLERALEFSEAIDALTSHPKVKIFCHYALSKDDWKGVSLICKWLSYFCSASALMAAKKYPTLSFSLRIYFVLISYVSKLEQRAIVQESMVMAAGVRACKAKLLDFFDKSTYDSEYYYFATVLDPRFKDSLFRSNDRLASDLFSEEWVSDCAEALQDTCSAFYSPSSSNSAQSKPLVTPNEARTDAMSDFARDWRANLPTQTILVPPSSSYKSKILSSLIVSVIQTWALVRVGSVSVLVALIWVGVFFASVMAL